MYLHIIDRKNTQKSSEICRQWLMKYFGDTLEEKIDALDYAILDRAVCGTTKKSLEKKKEIRR